MVESCQRHFTEAAILKVTQNLMTLAQFDLVALEEHYSDPGIDARLGRRGTGPVAEALAAGVDQRIRRLDRLGIAVEVLALAPPGLQGIVSSDAPGCARGANDRLANMVASSGKRLAGFAALPTIEPEAAADELSRCVEVLGFVGAMVHGPTAGLFLDDPRFDPIFARAEALKVPIYVHPSEIMPDVRDAYFEPYAQSHPMFVRAGWGYTIETGTHAVRLVLSGLFDRFPELQIILGHLGEGIPYLINRIDEALSRDTPMKNFRDVFARHFHITTSGFFSDNALACCMKEMGVGRVMFSIDAPFASEEAGVRWFANLDVDSTVKHSIAAGNARQLLGL